MNLTKINPDNFVSGALASDVTNTTSTEVIAAQGANLRTYITSIGITNSHSTTGTVVKLLNGSTLMWRGYAYAGAGFMTQVMLRGAANTAWNVQCETNSSAVQVSLSGFKSTE